MFQQLNSHTYSVARWSRAMKYAGPAVIGIGDRLRAGKRPRFVTSHSGQLSLVPSAGRKKSTGQSAVTLCGWGVKADMVHFTCACVCLGAWQVKLYAIPR